MRLSIQTALKAIFLLVVITVSMMSALGDTPKSKPTDWSVAIVEATMKRFPTPKDFGVWNYPRGLYLYGQYSFSSALMILAI